MANYYAFTKNQKPVLGSPIQGTKPKGGKSVPIYLGEDCLVPVVVNFFHEGESWEQADSYRVTFTVDSKTIESNFAMRLGYVYTGSFLTKSKFLNSANVEFGAVVQFKFIGDELFIVRSFVGTIVNPYVHLIID